MKPPKVQSEDALLKRLKDVPESRLAASVEHTEGVNGSTVEPVYSARKMRCYSVTESELRQINLANIGITAFASMGSAMLAFWLDVFKDTVLAEKIPERAQEIVSYVQPILLVMGLAFWALSAATLGWRRNLIKLIKDESEN